MPSPTNAGDRAKAFRLRKALRKGKLPNVDALWLGEYDEESERRAKERKRSFAAGDFGASRARAKRTLKVDLQEEEDQAAIGTGAAAAAAAAALAAKEEGRRLDSLTVESVNALKVACDMYASMCGALLKRTEVLETKHVELMEALTLSHIERTNAEIELMRSGASGEGGVTDALLAQVLGRMGNGAKVKTPGKPAPPSGS